MLHFPMTIDRIPYTYELTNGPKELLFFGSQHLTDPSSVMFEQLRTMFLEFKPELVLIGDRKETTPEEREAFEKQVLELTPDKLIHNHADIGFTVKLALDHKIPWIPGRPTDKQKFAYLLENGYKPEHVFAYRLMRIVIQYRNSQDPSWPAFFEYAKGFLTRFEANTNWEGFDYSVENFLAIINALFAKNFTLDSLLNLPEIEAYALPDNKPPGWEHPSPLNEIGNLTWQYDDMVVVQKINQQFQNYNKIFILFGYSHASAQEPALRELMKRLNNRN